jgi:hypothetical protein
MRAGWRLQLSATATRRASGGRVSVNLRARGESWTFRATVRAGAVRVVRRLPERLRGFRRAALRVTYAGSPAVRPGTARRTLRRAAKRPAAARPYSFKVVR